MDINTIRLIRNSLDSKKAQIDKGQDKKQDKNDDIKGCLKLTDYMSF
jgi:hypothetical protein